MLALPGELISRREEGRGKCHNAVFAVLVLIASSCRCPASFWPTVGWVFGHKSPLSLIHCMATSSHVPGNCGQRPGFRVGQLIEGSVFDILMCFGLSAALHL